MIRVLSAGESHGQGISVIIDGLPAGLIISIDSVNKELARRRSGLGRSERMKNEKDDFEILSGIRNGKTIGSPVTMFVKNEDYRKEEFMIKKDKVCIPRPGHADLAGSLKFGFSDIQNVAERASARETVARVCAGAVFKTFLKEFNIRVSSKVIAIGIARDKNQMKKLIEGVRRNGDSLGGIVEVYADNVFPGLGSYTQFDKRLDARIGLAMFSIPSVKGVEIGEAIKGSTMFGSEFHDEIYYNPQKGIYRKTNNAGGIEGGVSNGERIVIRLYVKPIPTLQNPLKSIDLTTKKTTRAPNPRADVCVVESIGVIAESMLAYVLADAICEKFGSDTLKDIKNGYRLYLKRIKNV
ncbi:MAG: chorismate synthase [candidate division WOR-3 bacterium]